MSETFGEGIFVRLRESRIAAWERDPDVVSEVDIEAFMPHSHPGGETYLVLEGEVYDEDGTYPPGSIVWMDPGSTHTPKTKGQTLILVLWPDGVKAA